MSTIFNNIITEEGSRMLTATLNTLGIVGKKLILTGFSVGDGVIPHIKTDTSMHNELESFSVIDGFRILPSDPSTYEITVRIPIDTLNGQNIAEIGVRGKLEGEEIEKYLFFASFPPEYKPILSNDESQNDGATIAYTYRLLYKAANSSNANNIKINYTEEQSISESTLNEAKGVMQLLVGSPVVNGRGVFIDATEVDGVVEPCIKGVRKEKETFFIDPISTNGGVVTNSYGTKGDPEVRSGTHLDITDLRMRSWSKSYYCEKYNKVIVFSEEILADELYPDESGKWFSEYYLFQGNVKAVIVDDNDGKIKDNDSNAKKVEIGNLFKFVESYDFDKIRNEQNKRNYKEPNCIRLNDDLFMFIFKNADPIDGYKSIEEVVTENSYYLEYRIFRVNSTDSIIEIKRGVFNFGDTYLEKIATRHHNGTYNYDIAYATLLSDGVLNSFKLVNATLKLDDTNYRLDLVTKSLNFDETIVALNPEDGQEAFLIQLKEYLQFGEVELSPVVNRFNYYKLNIEILESNECNISLIESSSNLFSDETTVGEGYQLFSLNELFLYKNKNENEYSPLLTSYSTCFSSEVGAANYGDLLAFQVKDISKLDEGNSSINLLLYKDETNYILPEYLNNLLFRSTISQKNGTPILNTFLLFTENEPKEIWDENILNKCHKKQYGIFIAPLELGDNFIENNFKRFEFTPIPEATNFFLANKHVNLLNENDKNGSMLIENLNPEQIENFNQTRTIRNHIVNDSSFKFLFGEKLDWQKPIAPWGTHHNGLIAGSIPEVINENDSIPLNDLDRGITPTPGMWPSGLFDTPFFSGRNLLKTNGSYSRYKSENELINFHIKKCFIRLIFSVGSYVDGVYTPGGEYSDKIKIKGLNILMSSPFSNANYKEESSNDLIYSEMICREKKLINEYSIAEELGGFPIYEYSNDVSDESTLITNKLINEQALHYIKFDITQLIKENYKNKLEENWNWKEIENMIKFNIIGFGFKFFEDGATSNYFFTMLHNIGLDIEIEETPYIPNILTYNHYDFLSLRSINKYKQLDLNEVERDDQIELVLKKEKYFTNQNFTEFFIDRIDEFSLISYKYSLGELNEIDEYNLSKLRPIYYNLIDKDYHDLLHTPCASREKKLKNNNIFVNNLLNQVMLRENIYNWTEFLNKYNSIFYLENLEEGEVIFKDYKFIRNYEFEIDMTKSPSWVYSIDEWDNCFVVRIGRVGELKKIERAFIINSYNIGNKVYCTLLLNNIADFTSVDFDPGEDEYRCILNTKTKEFYLNNESNETVNCKFSYDNLDETSQKAILDFYSYFQTLANTRLTFDSVKNRYLGTMINNLKIDTNYYYRTNLFESSFFNRKRNIGVSLSTGRNNERITSLLFNPIVTNEEFLSEQPIIGEIYYLQNDGTIKNLVTNYPLLVHLKNGQIITCPSLLNNMNSFYNLEEFMELNKEELLVLVSNNMFKSFFNDTTINAIVYADYISLFSNI
jgi:hypothetical protein